ncbi:MAG: hypothetical protein ACTHMQ_11320 [Protaetiibacter sp.]
MEPAGGVDIDAADTRRARWRGALLSVGVAVAAGLLTLLAPQSAHADDGASRDSAPVGSLVHGLTSTVTDVIDPVLTPLPDVRDVPVVGGLVGEVADSRPVGSVTRPVTTLVDSVLGDTAGSLPLVRDLVGDAPLSSVAEPVAEVVDGALGHLAGVAPDSDAVPGAGEPASDVAARWLASSLVGLAGELSSLSYAGPLAVVGAVGAEGPLRGPVSAPGDITPTSAVTAGGPPIGLAAAVLGAGLLFLLAAGRVRPAGFRAPPSPVFATDTSPD